VPTEVLATPRADQQIAGLDRTQAGAFGEFLDDLAARGCQALGYRLSGPAPVDHLCVKHLRDSLRVVVAFEGQQRAWILLVGRHDNQDPVLNVYAELYRLLGAEPPDSAGRDKPPCCEESTDLPPVLGAAVTELVDRAAVVRRTRRQPASLPAWGARPPGKVMDRSSRFSLLAVGSHRKVAKSSGTRALRCHVLSQTSTSLTYRIRLVRIGVLVVKVATLGRANWTICTPPRGHAGRPTSESAEMRAFPMRAFMPSHA
jgi:hypothetical protein